MKKLTKLDVFLVMTSLFVTTLLLLGSMVGYVMYASHQASKPNVQTATVNRLSADKILEQVNAERAKVGVAPLVSDPRLVATAQARADDMVARNYFSHRDPVTNENMVKDLPYCLFNSENISYHHASNESVITGWMGSKPHHDAMLDPRYTTTGIAVANNDAVVQNFCQ
jgi:uncharacterized protein YkwD